MNKVLAAAAAAEAATGAIVLAFPSEAVRLLFGAEIAGAGIDVTRMAGIALIGLGVACWPAAPPRQPHLGMLTYGVLVTLYFVYAGTWGDATGFLLWPAVVVHIVIAVLLAVTLPRKPQIRAGRT